MWWGIWVFAEKYWMREHDSNRPSYPVLAFPTEKRAQNWAADKFSMKYSQALKEGWCEVRLLSGSK